jgi:hypothetical protein
MLYKMEAETAKDGRGLVIGRIYARDGRLIAVCVSILLLWFLLYQVSALCFLIHLASLDLFHGEQKGSRGRRAR